MDDDSYRAWVKADPAQWRATDAGSLHRRGDLLNGANETGELDTTRDTLTTGADVQTCVQIALTHNPSILAAQRRVERLGQRVPQITSWDDPMFQVAPVGEMAQTAAGEVGLMTSLSQKLPFPGKLSTRGDIAQQDVAMALADLQQTRLEVVADTRRAFWSYYFTTRAIEITRQSRQLLSQFQQIAETQYKAGTRSQSDVLRASVELSNLDNELITLAQRQAAARSMLNQLLDRPVNAPLAEPSPIQPDNIAEQLHALLATAAEHNPTIRKIHEQIEQYRQRKKLASLSRWPDLTVSVTYNAVDDRGLAPMANGQDQWWLGFGVNLPIWFEKYAAAEREALHGVLEGVADLTAQRNRVAFQVQDAYLKVETQQKLVELFRDVIVPQAKQTVDASASGYRAGSVDFLTLVDNWRKLLNFDLMYHRALADMEQAVAELERAVGQDVARDPQSPVPTEDSPPMTPFDITPPPDAASPPDAPPLEGEELTP